MSQLYVPDARLLPRALLHPNQSGRAHPAGPATRSSAREGDKTPHEHGQPPPGRDRQHGHVEPYRRAFQTVLPQARIVVDKFHVVRMANEALEKIRKGLRKELKPNQRRTLKGDRKILLKRAHDVSDRERLIMETWTGAFPPALGGLRAQGALLPYLGLYQSAWCRTGSRHLD